MEGNATEVGDVWLMLWSAVGHVQAVHKLPGAHGVGERGVDRLRDVLQGGPYLAVSYACAVPKAAPHSLPARSRGPFSFYDLLKLQQTQQNELPVLATTPKKSFP